VLLRKDVLRDLIDAPSGPMMTVQEASCLLECAPTKITALALEGTLHGRIEDNRVVGVARASLRRALGEIR
jgi:hypothetical protein